MGDDEFSKFVCRSYAAKVLTIKKKVETFRKLYNDSEKLQKNMPKVERFKRGRKLDLNSESQTLQNQRVKRTRVSIAAVFQRPLNSTTGFIAHRINETERSDDANILGCVPQHSDVPKSQITESHQGKRRVLADRFQQIAPKPNVNIPSLDNSQNTPTTDTIFTIVF